jgi:pilus assembly protein FimV
LDDGEKIEEEELQTDIDSLLDDPGDDAGDDDWEQDSLISQDDIEELIKSSENEDEDALGDLDSLGSIDGSNTDGDDFGDDSGNETNDDQEITKEDVEDEDPGAEDSKVILEESGESSSPEKPGKKTKKKKKRKGSTKIGKKLIIILLILLFVSILSLAGYFFLKKDDKNLPQQQIVTKTVLVEKPMIESVEINVDENSSKSNQAKMSKPVSDDLIVEPLIMKDFIILAPETIEGLSYIQVDINIDYSNDSAYYEIKENMPFYRDIVYSSVQKALDSNKGDKITEPDLLQIVQKALIKALPEGSIKKVSFKSFKAG